MAFSELCIAYVMIKVVGEFSLGEVLLVLEEVEKWKDIVFHLGVPKHVADHIEYTHKDAVTQKSKAVSWWMQNSSTASWKELADALVRANYPTLAERVRHIAGMDYIIFHANMYYCEIAR